MDKFTNAQPYEDYIADAEEEIARHHSQKVETCIVTSTPKTRRARAAEKLKKFEDEYTTPRNKKFKPGNDIMNAPKKVTVSICIYIILI